MVAEEERYDAIIVGAGPAGSTAAYVLARAGLEVALIERGKFAGEKNMTGGRLYSHSLARIIPEFAEEAPLERKVTREKISMMTRDSAITMDFTSARLAQEKQDSYTVLRCEFDRWLAEKAEAAGAIVAYGIRVDELIMKDGKVCGVIAGDDEMEADVVILADGVNSLLAQKAGLRKELTPHEVGVGVKEVLKLPAKVIEDRFNLNPGEGAAWLFEGSITDGQVGGGFLYTNKDTVSLGLVYVLSGIEKIDKSIVEMLEEFKNHPAVQPLIKDAQLVEYSGHMVPEAGYHMVPTLYEDGVLVVGDAAALVLNIGYMVRGLDLAVASGEAAAKAVLTAKEKRDYSAASLAYYKKLLDDSFVMKDMLHYKNFPKFMDNPRIFKNYPEAASDLLTDMFVVKGDPNPKLSKLVISHLKKIGFLNIVRDTVRGIKAL